MNYIHHALIGVGTAGLGATCVILFLINHQPSLDAPLVLPLALLLMGSIVIYCFWLIITSTAFWIVRVDEIVNLFQGVYAAGRWPVGIYPRWLQVGLTFIIPVAFAVTIPAEALTSRLTPLILAGTCALTIFFVILARVIWRLGLKNYSGASA